MKNILARAQQNNSRRRFISLLLSGVLLGVGVGVPNQIFTSLSANAAIPTIRSTGATSGCLNMTAVGSADVTSWKYSYDGNVYVTVPGQSTWSLSYNITGGWYSQYFQPWIIAVGPGGESLPGQITLYSGECTSPYKSFTPVVATTTAPSGTTALGSTLTSQVSFVAAPISTSLTYSWQSCNSAIDLNTCSTISGATSATYVPISNDVDKFIRSIVVGTSTVNGVPSSTTATSELTQQISSSAPGVPGIPTAIAGYTQATVTVSAPNSGGIPTSYIVTASPQVGGITKTCTVLGASGSCVVTGLTNGEVYTFTSNATNGSGTSLDSSPSSGATPFDTVAPTVTLAAAVITSTSGTITFTITGDIAIDCSTLSTTSGTDFTYTGISAITGIVQTTSNICTITATSTATGNAIPVVSSLVRASSFSIADMSAHTQTILNESPQSTTVTIPDVTPPTLSSLSASNIADISARLRFTSNEAGTYYYLVYAASDTAPSALEIEAQGTAVTKGTSAAILGVNTVTATGLSAGTAYKTYIIVKDPSGYRSEVSTISLTTLLAAPGIPEAPTTVAGNTQVTVTVVPAIGGETPVSYTVVAYTNIGGVAGACVVSGASGSCVVTGLTNGSAYTFQSKANGSAGHSSSSYSSASISTIPSVPDTTAPTVTLAASAANSASGTITFTVTGNEAITCSTLSTLNGTDFAFTNISAITGILQTSPTVCTITATSTATEGGEAVTSTLTAAGTFSVTDTAGNAQTTLTSSPKSTIVTVTDATAPTLTSFSSTTSDGTYKAGATINITATFNEAVTTAAAITVTLDTGETVLLTHGSSGTTLTGTYTVGAGKTSADLTVSSYALTSAPTDTAGNAMSTTPLPTGANNIAGAQAIVIDTTAPTQTVTGIHISADTAGSSTTDFITKTAPQTITATLSAVLVSGESLWASLDAGSSYTDISLSVSSTSVSWASATLSGTSSIKLQVRDAAGNVGSIATQTYVLDTVAPTITAISSSSSDATYKLGSTITITATASESVLSGATFVVTLETGTTDRTVTLTASADGTTLTGTYTVQSGDVSADLTANAISAGSISDVAGNAMTSTTLPSGGNNIAGAKAIVVDGVVPTVTAITADVVYGGNAVVQSTETGSVYLVNTSVSVEDLASITGAAGALWNSVTIASAATNTDLAVTGLNAGTYKAYAVDAAGNLSVVSTGTVTVLPQAPGTPLAPTAVAGDTQVTVTVVAPSGGTPSSHLITASPQVGGITKTCTVSGASGSCVVAGLTNGTAYTFTSTATNAGGTSSASPASNSATPNDSPVAPLVASTPAPTGTVTNGSTLTSAVTFTGTPTPDLTYTWQRCTSSTDFATCTTISGATASTYVLTDTDAAKYIRSVVTATNTTAPAAVGTSAVTAVIAPVAPAAPTSLVATAGDGSAVISFTQGSNGGSAITNYKYSLDGTNFTLLSPADATSPITITGLTNGTAYTIYLEAVNIAGISIPSDPVSVTPADVTPPTLVSSVLAADGLTLTLTYNETLSATTASTSEYTITVNGASVTISTAVVSGLTVVLTLASAVDQGKTVLAAYTDPTTSNDANAIQDAAGNDAATFTAQSVTNNSSHVSTPGTPPAPTAVAGDAQVTVTVTASNSGGTPASYVVTASPGGATCSVTGAAGSCVVSGLTNGTPYTFTSTATNTSGSSSPSPDSASATPVAVVVPPTPTPTPVVPTPVVPTPVVPTPVVPTIVVPTPVTPTLPAPEVIAAAKVVVEKVVVDTVVAVAAAKVAVEKAVEAVAVKVTAEKIVAAVEAQVAVAAIAQKTAITIAAQAVVELKSSTNAAVTKASTSPTTQKAVVSVATTVKTAVAAATKTATALAIAANSNKPLDITVGALASKTASAETIAAANVIAAAAKAAADRVAKVATDKATSAKNAAIVATKEATVAAALIVTEQKQASDAAIFAKEAADTMLKATLEKSTTTAEAQIATDAVVQALNEKAQLADDAVKATDETVRLEIVKKIDQATLKVADLQKVADAAVQKADTANKTQAVAKAASDAAVKEASVQAAQAVAAKTESAAKSAVAVQAAVAATVAAKVATAAKAEAAKVPATAAVVPKASTTTKNSAQATVTGLKPGQKVKVTVNIKVK